MRSGIIAQKVGMTRLFTPEGNHVPVTVLKVDSCEVVGVRSADKDGYVALQVGAGKAKEKNTAKPQRVQFAKANVAPKKKVVEFRVSDDCVVKRWNFGGDQASHGVSLTHRSGGSTGQCQDPGKVFKNKKMPGHLGAEKVTVQNLEVIELDETKGLIMVKGAVPGFDGNVVIVKDAVKRALHKDAPIPAGLKVKAEAVAVAVEDDVAIAGVDVAIVADVATVVDVAIVVLVTSYVLV